MSDSLYGRATFKSLSSRGLVVMMKDSDGISEVLQHGGDSYARWRRVSGRGESAVFEMVERLPVVYGKAS